MKRSPITFQFASGGSNGFRICMYEVSISKTRSRLDSVAFLTYLHVRVRARKFSESPRLWCVCLWLFFSCAGSSHISPVRFNAPARPYIGCLPLDTQTDVFEAHTPHLPFLTSEGCSQWPRMREVTRRLHRVLCERGTRGGQKRFFGRVAGTCEFWRVGRDRGPCCCRTRASSHSVPGMKQGDA